MSVVTWKKDIRSAGIQKMLVVVVWKKEDWRQAIDSVGIDGLCKKMM